MWTFDELMEACPPLPPRPIGVRGDNGIYVYKGKSIMQNVFNLVYFGSAKCIAVIAVASANGFDSRESNYKHNRKIGVQFIHRR